MIESGEIRYTPPAGYAGTVTFTYAVSDGNGGTSTGTATVVVQNAPPVADDDTVSTATDTPTTVDVLDGDTDPNIPGTTQVLVVTGANADNGATVVVNADGTLTVTPATGFTGVITVTYTLADGAGGTDTGVLNVTVDNAAPVAVPDGPVSTPTDTSVLVNVTANDTDPNPGDTLTITPGSISAPVDGGGTTRGTAVIESGEIRYTPPAGYAGTVTFTYAVSDGNGGTSTGTATVVVQNAPPVADDDTVSTATDTPTTVDVLDGDTDPNIPGTTQVLVVTGANADNGATVVVNADGTLTVTPATGFTGVITVTYTLADGAGGTDTGVLNVTVDNAAPVAVPDGPVSTPTDTSVLVNVTANDTDPNPGDTLTIAPGSISAPVDGGGTTRGTAVIESGEIRYTPPAGYAGTVTFTYAVSDGNGGTSTGTATVVVQNAPPVADDDTVSTATDTPTTVDVLDGDTDPNIPGTTQVLVVTGANADNGATVVVNADGTLTVTPATGFTGVITVTYTLADGAGGTDTGVLNVTVDNAAPVAVPDTATTPYLTPVEVNIVVNDTDANTGDTPTVVPGSVTFPLDAGGTLKAPSRWSTGWRPIPRPQGSAVWSRSPTR